MIKYLSPSSIACFNESIEEFFLRYVVRVPRPPQTEAMAAGAAFDACCKAYILVHKCKSIFDLDGLFLETGQKLEKRKVKYGSDYTPVVFRTDLSDHMNTYECLLAESVEMHNIAWARDVGKRIFIDYRDCGALSNLLDDMEPGTCKPIDELTLNVERSNVERSKQGLVLLGKPDLMYVSKRFQLTVVDDWKCNGYVSNRTVSPTPGYVDSFPQRAMHKNCVLEPGGGMSVNTLPIPEIYKLQLTVYQLLAKADVVGISQLVFNKDGVMKVAKHRYRVPVSDTKSMLINAQRVWDACLDYFSQENIQSPGGGSFAGIINSERCRQLVEQGKVLRDPKIAALVGRG